jgi:membrane protein DedA with SNARE-associated domain
LHMASSGVFIDIALTLYLLSIAHNNLLKYGSVYLMEYLNTLIPAFEHLGMAGYWLVLVVAFAESLAFVGVVVPGGLFIILAGFLASQEYFDIGDLIWFAGIGAILGDSFSYWLGIKSKKLFRHGNRIFNPALLEKGEQFFIKHGDKSILFGRFMAPMRPIVPFVAGLFRMRFLNFLFWNVISGFLWASVFLLLGYFFGGTANLIDTWITRVGFILFVVVSGIIISLIFIKRGKKHPTTIQELDV